MITFKLLKEVDVWQFKPYEEKLELANGGTEQFGRFYGDLNVCNSQRIC
jgi:hypothetical protein